MKNIFLKTFEFITRKPSYRPEIKWSSNSWTHNVFRVYEMIFGRKVGIRVEARLYSDSEGNNLYEFYTVEALLAHLEYRLRNIFELPKFHFVRVQEYQYATIGGFQSPMRPIFNLAIAFDNAVEDNAAGTTITTHTTANFTITGSDITLTACGQGQDNSPNYPTSVKWGGSGGTAMTDAGANVLVTGAALTTSLWYLGSLSTDTKTVYVLYGASQSRIGVGLISMTGTSATPLGAVNTNLSTTYSSGATVSLTTTSANSLIVGGMAYNAGSAGITSTGTGQTSRYTGEVLANHGFEGSTQTTTSTASYTTSYTWTSASGGWCVSVIEVKAAAAAGPTNLKSLDTNVKANIKSYNTNVLANIKSIDTNA